MTISLKHAFQSLKADGGDATVVRPSNWNAEHELTAASGVVVGRDSSGAGAVQELPVVFDSTRNNVNFGAGTGALRVMAGTTGQQPAGAVGDIRYDSTLSKLRAFISAAWASLATEDFVATSVSAAQGVFAQCRLTKPGANLRLDRYNGSKLTINGVAETIPSAGVNLAPTSATPDTTYYIYAYMDTGTMTLEYSATVPDTHTDGTKIKTGDATRALVGMARAITGPAWIDTTAQRFVISWYNQQPINFKKVLPADATVSSTSWDEFDTDLRAQFITWATPAVQISANGMVNGSVLSAKFEVSVGIDDTTPEDVWIAFDDTQNSWDFGFSLNFAVQLAEGYHYATLLGQIDSGDILVYGSGTNAQRTTIYGMIMG